MNERGTSGWMQPLEPHRGVDPTPDYARDRAVYYLLMGAVENPDQELAALIRPVYSSGLTDAEAAFLAGAFDVPRHLVGWSFAVKAPGDGALILQGQTGGTEAGFQLARLCCQAALGHGSEEHGYLVQDRRGAGPAPRLSVVFDRNAIAARRRVGLSLQNHELLTVARALPREIRAWFRGFPKPT